MSKVEDFLTAKEEEEIVQAIREAERNTSGEIRVHIERTTESSHYDRALEVFQILKMFNTQQRNGVLLYIAVDDHKFVIYGDEGINKVVPENFWETTKEAIQNQFKQGNFKQGIIDGVLKAGKELQTHFPWTTDDEDELSNEISKG
ncbi:TPM domain-containing protein [Tenacibaculum singaporense]|uniref:TPM domain-containing protein n=1 Tax=Tenacibaculum singaporense TaxID=2358479 RepID=UPI000F67C8AA|nr:TPM domain-containing protein [Tenacibaculum singaporense]RSC95725.1 TPM domain-containing protein [Tenacibaculum singaporense]